MGYKYVYDVYIIKKSGLPLLAGCTGSAYCQAHMNQHELRSGLLSAMFTFSKESFTESNLEQIIFNDVKISLYTEPKSDILLAFIHNREFKEKKIFSKLVRTWTRFHAKFSDKIGDQNFIDTSLFETFRDDLRDLGVTPPEKFFNTGMMQIEKEEYAYKYPNLFSWLKSKIWG